MIIESRPGPAEQPHPQRDGTARKSRGEEALQEVITHMHLASTDGARTECGTICEYNTLALKGSTEDTAVVGPLRSGYYPDTMETVEIIDMDTWELDRQRVPPAYGQPENEGGKHPERQRVLLAQSQNEREEEWGGPPCPAAHGTHAQPVYGKGNPGPILCASCAQPA